MSEIAKWIKRSELMRSLFECTKSRVFFKGAPSEYFLVARTAARPENFAGFHADNLLFILDEASGIDEAIFETVLGALTGRNNKLLMCSNPTRTSGFFKRAFYEERELYLTFKVNSQESSRVSRDWIERLIKQYGEESDVVRVRIRGEFPTGEANGLIPLEWVEMAMNRELKPEGNLIIGVDIARQGDDSTVLCARRGDAVIAMEQWRHADLMTTSGRILRRTRELMALNRQWEVEVRIDDDGIGAGVSDRLEEVFVENRMEGASITRCHNGGKSLDGRYANFVTAAYFALRDRFESGQISLPRDDDLIGELTTRRYSLNSADKLILERKDEFKKRIKRSPDKADALSLAFAPVVTVSAPQYNLSQSYWIR